MNPEFHYTTVLPVFKRLSSDAFLKEQYERRMKYADEGMKMSLNCGYSKKIPAFMNHKADALEKLGRKEEAIQAYQQAYYMATLFMVKDEEKVSSDAYLRLTGELLEL